MRLIVLQLPQFYPWISERIYGHDNRILLDNWFNWMIDRIT